MRSLKQNLIAESFIIATGFAALLHSTWTLATLFSGNEPTGSVLAYLSWAFPGFLIAFSLDIGQIVTSHEIRQARERGKNPKVKYITFSVFAIATYYTQWLYMAHHVPMLSLGEGVSATHVQIASTLRDLSIWIVPAFLPLSTLLYTVSRIKTEEVISEIVIEKVIEEGPKADQQKLLPERSGTVTDRIKEYSRLNPEMKALQVAEELGVGVSTVYKVMKEMKQ